MSAADEALRILIVRHDFLDERAAAHVYRQALAAGKSLDMHLLEEKILSPDDIVKVVEERAKNALACRGCKTVTYLLPGQTAETLVCVRCKTPFVGSRRSATSSQFNVIEVRRSKTVPMVIAVLMLAAGGGVLFFLNEQRTAAANGQVGPSSPTTANQAELELLVEELFSSAAAGQWRRHFDCFGEDLQTRMTLKAVMRAGRAVAADSSLRKQWLTICARDAWIRVQSDADALSEKISARLSKDDKREFYVAVKGLLNAEPVPSKDAKLSRSKISEGRARGLIKVSVNGKPKEQKAKFALEDAEWRVTHLSDR